MIENTLENKEKFFAAYFGQKVIIGKYTVNSYLIDWLNSDDYLELLPLSSITDEDAETIGELFHKADMQLSPDNLAQWSIKEVKEQIKGLTLVTPIADYLRSKSYLIGWMGLTPDQLISYGWAQYKEV